MWCSIAIIDVKIDKELLAFIPHKYYFFNVVSLNFMG